MARPSPDWWRAQQDEHIRDIDARPLRGGLQHVLERVVAFQRTYESAQRRVGAAFRPAHSRG